MKSVKSVTYGAMSVGLIALILLFDRILVGNLGFMLSLIIPVPLVIYGMKFSFKESIVVYLTMVVASVIFNGMLSAVVSVAGFGLVGLVMVYANEQEYSAWKSNVLLFFSMSIIYTIMIVFFEGYFGVSITDTIDTIANFAPQLSYQMMYGVTILSIILTIFMEMFIVKTLVKLIAMRIVPTLKK